MGKKILIIGQAPPAVSQKVPYDTTMLYEMFQWAGVSKTEAQEIFEFDALVDKFPGFNENGGHQKPSLNDIKVYYDTTLKQKIDNADKVILLGNEAKNFIAPWFTSYGRSGKWVFFPHPSRRNYNLIMERKEELTKCLQNLIQEGQ